MSDIRDAVIGAFRRHFGRESMLIRSPGRVNLIGEHTDYNEGFVLPAAVDRAVWLALKPSEDQKIHLISLDMDAEFSCSLDQIEKSGMGWPDYILGVVDQFKSMGAAIPGFQCLFAGDVPIGGGMSSSAAIGGGMAFALNEMFYLGVMPLELVKLAQRSENQFVGVNCGIMDQYINIFGREKTVLKIDCRSLEYEYIPFATDHLRIVLCDTRVRRQLASSEYNVRRSQCEKGVSILRRYYPQVGSLRDVTPEMLASRKTEFDEVIYKRCHYVVHENLRVLEGCRDLQANNFKAFGEKMACSHLGLRDDYQVSCKELDLLAETAVEIPGVLGARMMGAGFGGCTIQLVEEDRLPGFIERIQEIYDREFPEPVKIHEAKLQGGTCIEPSPQ